MGSVSAGQPFGSARHQPRESGRLAVLVAVLRQTLLLRSLVLAASLVTVAGARMAIRITAELSAANERGGPAANRTCSTSTGHELTEIGGR